MRYHYNPDRETRELHRQSAIGDFLASARLLIARVRSGELDAYRVSLAAYLGDPVAIATGIEPWAGDQNPRLRESAPGMHVHNALLIGIPPCNTLEARRKLVSLGVIWINEREEQAALICDYLLD